MAKSNINLSDAIATWVSKSNATVNRVGDLASLTTTEDSSLVGAINELDSDLGLAEADITALKAGTINITGLNTTAQDLVGSINELHSEIDSADSASNFVGRVRGALSVSGDLSYNSSTGVFSTSGLASSTTDDLSEGSSNLYYTNERVDDRVNALLQEGTGITLTYDDTANTLTVAGSAQYADSDARHAISVTASTGLSYDDSSGVLAGVNATTTVKGVAKFSSTNFSVSSGTVSVKNDGIARANLKDEVQLIIYDSAGTAQKTLYGAGS